MNTVISMIHINMNYVVKVITWQGLKNTVAIIRQSHMKIVIIITQSLIINAIFIWPILMNAVITIRQRLMNTVVIIWQSLMGTDIISRQSCRNTVIIFGQSHMNIVKICRWYPMNTVIIVFNDIVIIIFNGTQRYGKTDIIVKRCPPMYTLFSIVQINMSTDWIFSQSHINMVIISCSQSCMNIAITGIIIFHIFKRCINTIRTDIIIFRNRFRLDIVGNNFGNWGNW